MKIVCFFLLIFCFSLQANPWGKDADLVSSGSIKEFSTKPVSTPLVRFGVAAIKFHQDVISPADGPRSHFIPSSSQYALEAMCKYGFFQGFLMGCDRLMRENNEEWVYLKAIDSRGCIMKLDPVP